MRIVLDTNVLIDAFSDDFSAQAKLMDAVTEGDITALSTHATRREYQTILHRLIRDGDYQQRVNDFIAQTEQVEAADVPIKLDDPEDYKFLSAAVGGGAEYLVTGDHHLLDVGEVDAMRIVTPQEAWTIFQEAEGASSEWQDWARGLGISK